MDKLFIIILKTENSHLTGGTVKCLLNSVFIALLQ